jgi:predicted ArsR family transcriptional regulator
MTSARQKVFAYIQKHRSVSALEIARDLGVTQANARHHLSLLKKDGRIEVLGTRSAGTKGGRPIKIYGISRNILGDGLPTLSHHLLEEMLGSVNAHQKAGVLKKLGQRLASSGTSGASPMIRLTETVKHLNKLGYHARWEAHASGPRIILGHCPYAAIIAEHPELCEMDSALLEECLGEPVEQSAKLEGDIGKRICVF